MHDPAQSLCFVPTTHTRAKAWMMSYPVDRTTAPEEVVPPVEAPEAMVREPLVPEKVAPAKQ
jgi:hypothetical protein